jgi:hypothetical protein
MEQPEAEERPVPYYLRPNKLQRTMNEQMVAWVPELASRWAATPMAANNRWLKPSEQTDRGQACYIPAEEEQERRQDYIWMPRHKDLPAGYYHLATITWPPKRPIFKSMTWCTNEASRESFERWTRKSESSIV